MGTWIRERLWAQISLALAAVIASGSYIMTALDLAERVSTVDSYWWKFLLWLFSTPPWISVVCFTVLSAIVLLRDHPAILAAAGIIKPRNPIPRTCASMRFVGGRFRQFLASGNYTDREFAEAAGRWEATMITLSKQGFCVPKFNVATDPVAAMKTSLAYIDIVQPIYSEGHVKEAKIKAASIAA